MGDLTNMATGQYDMTSRMDGVRLSNEVMKTLEGFLNSVKKGTQIPISEQDKVLEGISLLADSEIEKEYMHILYPLTKELAELGDDYIMENMERLSERKNFRLQPLTSPQRTKVYDPLTSMSSQPTII